MTWKEVLFLVLVFIAYIALLNWLPEGREIKRLLRC